MKNISIYFLLLVAMIQISYSQQTYEFQAAVIDFKGKQPKIKDVETLLNDPKLVVMVIPPTKINAGKLKEIRNEIDFPPGTQCYSQEVYGMRRITKDWLSSAIVSIVSYPSKKEKCLISVVLQYIDMRDRKEVESVREWKKDKCVVTLGNWVLFDEIPFDHENHHVAIKVKKL